jgi:trans-aconitate methyltransferase
MAKTTWNPTFYDTQHSFVAQYGMELISLLQPQKGERILDLGCGTGTLTSEIAKSGTEVIGIDNSPEMINRAKADHPNINFSIQDGENFHFEEPFAAVFSNAALHWMLAPEKVIACVWQCLLNNGRFVFEMGGKGNINLVAQAIQRAAADFGISHTPILNYFPSLAEYATLLEQGGFRVTYAVHFDRPTELKGKDGLRNWIKMFRNEILGQIPATQHEDFFNRVEELAHPHLYKNRAWWADYVRLRAVALKQSKGET